MNKRWIVIFITIIFFTLSAQATWEGSTAVSLHGELPEKGLYAASNAFPRNTVIEVSNPTSGQSVKVTVTERLKAPGLFLLVSKTTADALGMDYEDIIPAKAVIIDRRADTVSLYEEDMMESSETSAPEAAENISSATSESFLDSIMADLYPEEKADSVIPVTDAVTAVPEKEKSISSLMPELIPETKNISVTEPEEVVVKKDINPLIRIEKTKEPEPKEEIISKGTINYKGKNGEKKPEKLLPSAQEIIVPEMSLIFDESEPVDIASWEETDNILNIPVEKSDKDFTTAAIAVSDSPLFIPDTEVDEPGRLVMSSEIAEEKAPSIIEEKEVPVETGNSVAAFTEEHKIIDNQIPEKVVQSPVLRPLEPVRLFDSESMFSEEEPVISMAESDSVMVVSEPEKPENSMSLFDGLEDILDGIPEGAEVETVYGEPISTDEDFFISREVIVEPDIVETPEDEEYEEEYAEITLMEEPLVSDPLFTESLSLSPDVYEEFETDEYDDSDVFEEEEPVLTLMEADESISASDGDEEAFSLLPLDITEPEAEIIDDYSDEPEIAFLLEPSSLKPPEASEIKIPEAVSYSVPEESESIEDSKDALPDFLDSTDSKSKEVSDKFPKTASLEGLDNSKHEKLENAVAASLEKGEYLQIGAFSQSKPLLKNYERISSTYPLSLVPVEKNDKVLYKLLVGPLNEDEKGLILVQFKDMGYKDAFFIRR